MEKDTNKIIAFDSWTGGSNHFRRLLPALAERKMELLLVHIASWGNEPNCPKEQQIGDLIMRDISYYGGDSFERVLDIEQPDAVLLLSTDTFAHRAFIRYCTQRSIPSLNLYHGLVNVQDTEDESDGYSTSRKAYVIYVVSKLGKLFRHTFPCYIKSLIKTNGNLKDWVRFIDDIFSMARGLPSKRAAKDTKTDKCAVYVNADVEHAMRFYGFIKEDVVVVGNPDFLHFGLNQEMIGNWVIPSKDIDKTIMYIETGYSSVGLFYSGTQDFSDHLITTSYSLLQQGYRLCVKLKPHQANIQLIEKNLQKSGIELITNEQFLTKLMDCSACIVEASTLAMLPTLVGMHSLLANYGKLKVLPFGKVLTSYPRSYMLREISDVAKILLKDQQTFDKDEIKAWIDLNVGPLPPDKMPNRVVDILAEMISKKN